MNSRAAHLVAAAPAQPHHARGQAREQSDRVRGADELLRHEVQPHERRAVRHHLLLLLAPCLDVPPLPVDTNPTNLVPSRSATHLGTGSGYSRCSSGMGVGTASAVDVSDARFARSRPAIVRARANVWKREIWRGPPGFHDCAREIRAM